LNCSHCAAVNMPEANFCQGCGRPFAAPADPDPVVRAANDINPQQQSCFRCGVPLAAGAKVCEKCGLNMESLKPPPHSSAKAAGLAEVTFFKQPPPPDPQLAAIKTYAGWFTTILLAFFASYAAYSWLEASNVISRLIGGASGETPAQILTLSAPRTSNADSMPATVPERLDRQQAAAAPAAVSAEPVALQGATDTESRPAVSADIADADLTESADKMPSQSLQPQVLEAAVEKGEQAFAPEAAPITSGRTATPDDMAALSPSKPVSREEETQSPAKKRVVVTQIEPNKQSTPGSEIEAFFRRMKKSIKQGVSERPCTQQERALNQCN
jgi:ribosomal protein L40E